jgi:LytS/YehU family sensor histidine kinase
LYHLPAYTSGKAAKFTLAKLFSTLFIGAVMMMFLVTIHQLCLPHYHFQSMILMYEFRGLIINLTVNLFLFLLYQNHVTQAISRELDQMNADKTAAQYELLKQQVNPHFLFNSLNTLKSMVEAQDKNAPHFIVMLSDFYRSALEKRNDYIIPLQEELETLQAYMFLLKSRFEAGIQLEIDIEPPHVTSMIPSFTLQLLVENCIKHNVVSLAAPLVIRIYTDNESLIVENNLQVKRSPVLSTYTGLNNIIQRYQHLSGRDVVITKTEDFFTVELPVIYEDSHH